MDSESNRYRVIMLPWLAHGHISPFLELAKRLSTKYFHIYMCSTAINLLYIEQNLDPKYSESIELVELKLPSSSDLPPHFHTTNGLPPHLMKTLIASSDMSSPEFTILLKNLRPHLLIYDFCQWWAADSALSLNIPSVQFLTSSAAAWCVVLNGYTAKSLADQQSGEISFEDFKYTNSIMKSTMRSCGIVLIKSTREVDGKAIDYMSQIVEMKVLPIGPLIQEIASSEEENQDSIDIFKWLYKKKASSVVYISFGSEKYLSVNEIKDVAYVLEQSNVSFIWVIRFPHGSKINLEKVLPHGFVERLGERCLIVEKWAPQTKILRHSSIGGFVSHCGWASVMESIHYGIPIIAIPMQYDQPHNARLVEEIGVGINVGEGKDGRINREAMLKAVNKVVVEEGSRKIREKVLELSEIMMKEEAQELNNEVMENLIRLCQRNMYSFDNVDPVVNSKL